MKNSRSTPADYARKHKESCPASRSNTNPVKQAGSLKGAFAQSPVVRVRHVSEVLPAQCETAANPLSIFNSAEVTLAKL